MMNKNYDDYIYYDIQVNNYESSGRISQPLKFSETRNYPIIQNPNKYTLSIVRFELDTYSLPSFIADIEPFPNTNPNAMIDKITLEYDNNGAITSFTENLIWEPTNQHITQPSNLSANNKFQNNSTEYYWGNSFRHFIDLMNNTIENLTTQIKLSLGAGFNNLVSPKFLWNTSSNCLEVIAQEQYFNENLNPHFSIYFNRALYAKFTSLPAYKNLNNTDKQYKIYMKNDLTTNLIVLTIDTTDYEFIKTTQEYSTISNWSPVSSIMITTNVLPIVSSQIATPQNYINGSLIQNTIPMKTEKIISDFATNQNVYKPNLIYIPSAEYRKFDLIGNSDIKTIDINVYWKSRTGEVHQFYLQSGASFSMKMLFELKK